MTIKNRVLLYLPPVCHCDRIKRRLEKLHEVCEQIQQSAAGVVEFWEPKPEDILEAGKSAEVSLLISAEAERCSISADIPQHTIDELRRIASMLAEAADGIEADFGREVQA